MVTQHVLRVALGQIVTDGTSHAMLAASYLPSQTAARIDPQLALRSD
jgi:hypothetical protein